MEHFWGLTRKEHTQEYRVIILFIELRTGQFNAFRKCFEVHEPGNSTWQEWCMGLQHSVYTLYTFKIMYGTRVIEDKFQN